MSNDYSNVCDLNEWIEISIGKYKIKIRGCFNDFEDLPELVSIEENNILPTVSRRYNGRQFIDIWFWDNRVYKVKGKASMLAALYNLSGNPIPDFLEINLNIANYEKALMILQNEINYH